MKWPPNEAGGIVTAAHPKQVSEKRLPPRLREINETFGPPVLCTWRYVSGLCRFQTTLPEFARKLSKRSTAQRVGYSVTNRYLRIFEEPMELWRARRLVARYLEAANGAFSVRASRLAASKSGADQ